jgi:hypothetical protein
MLRPLNAARRPAGYPRRRPANSGKRSPHPQGGGALFDHADGCGAAAL